jgi:hypothetical protein
MDPATFERELARFRVVRSRDYVDTRAWRRKQAARTTAAAAPEPRGAMDDDDAASFVSAGAEPSAVATAPLTAEQRLVYGDFWAGLESWLALFLSDAGERKAVASAFDQAHYSLLKSMNLEDVSDMAAMVAAEAATWGGGGGGRGDAHRGAAQR